MGLDPQGYGNPDFCWLSLRDTLIWSFAGPIGAVIIVSPGVLQSPRFLGVWETGRVGWKGFWGPVGSLAPQGSPLGRKG